MLHERADGSVECSCDLCYFARASFPGPDAVTKARVAGWGEAPPPGVSGRWWCKGCLEQHARGEKRPIAKRGKRTR